jgi:hypothetical protein
MLPCRLINGIFVQADVVFMLNVPRLQTHLGTFDTAMRRHADLNKVFLCRTYIYALLPLLLLVEN